MGKPLKIALAGLGTVGVGVLDLLRDNGALLAQRCGRPLEVVAVSARSRNKPRGDHDLSRFQWFDDPVEMARSADADVLVELIGGEDGPARAAVEAALQAGRHVVTANKALLAHHGVALARMAEEAGVALNFEAAVAGGIPIVKMMRESVAGNAVRRVYGILNGTCNYILTRMEEDGREFDDVLKEAQELGYAEAAPTFDIGGFDAAHKLAILTSLAFGCEISMDDVYVEGIEDITLDDIRYARGLGYRIKLLAVAVDTGEGIEQRVHPTLVPIGSPIAEVGDVFNAVEVRGDFVDDVMLQGRGAGAHPTASSVVADIVDIARGIVLPPLGLPARQLQPFRKARMRAHEGGYYVAMDLLDQPGEVAAVARAFADEGISIESIVQKGRSIARVVPLREGEVERETAPFILITHDTQEAAMRVALARIVEEGHCVGTPRMIRIERFR